MLDRRFQKKDSRFVEPLIQTLLANRDIKLILQRDAEIIQALFFQVFMIENDQIQKQGTADLTFPLNEARFSG